MYTGAIGTAGHLQGAGTHPHRDCSDDHVSGAVFPKGIIQQKAEQSTAVPRHTWRRYLRFMGFFIRETRCKAKASGLGRVLAAADNVQTAGPPPGDGTIYSALPCIDEAGTFSANFGLALGEH